MIFETLALLNNNKIIWGITMLLLNMGSKYVLADLGKIHESLLANEIAKKIVIFSMFFVSTRDLLVAFLLSVLYIIIIDGIFHEKRNFSLVKGTNLNSVISEEEYKKAKETIILYEKQLNVSHENPDNLYDKYLNNIYVLRNT